MTPNEIADLVDLLLDLIGGILVTLYAFHVIGKSERLDAWRAKVGKPLRWIGPLYIVFGLAHYFMSAN